ncbi:hypothetical protein PVAND_014804 [Polypedilum vanderplanki]|uniref:Chitin-binding type-2 domain-containing protein n=1 Tax=Polypedilum vanderplanki TaxID=319348 RepID=A0A9J6BAT3_POLVA|nr:hypothetical protein PVAND_014804 [Polypedilum vanderplanki]
MFNQIFIISSILLLTVYGALNDDLFNCNGHPDVPFYARNRRGCAWFFTCNPGLPGIEGRCPNPFVFNHQQQICDYKENVDCVDADPITECPEKGFALISHPDACSKFVVCLDGKQQDRDCSPGLHFSSLEGKCVDPFFAQCTIDEAFCAANKQFEVNGRIPSTRNCNSYYMCNEKGVVPHNCGPNLHFNAENGYCDTIDNANCDVSTNLPDLEGIPENFDNLCIDKVDGSSNSFPDSCDFWYLCANGKAYINRCGTDAIFDINELRCVAKAVEGSKCATEIVEETSPERQRVSNRIFQFLENAKLNQV